MSVREFDDDDVAITVNRSFGQFADNCTEPDEFYSVDVLHKAVFYVALTIGIPGNVLSAIVWLRQGSSSSAVYLASLAVNDLAYLLSTFVYISEIVSDTELGWLDDAAGYLAMSAATLEPLLVLSFSVERLIAIHRPLQVRCIRV